MEPAGAKETAKPTASLEKFGVENKLSWISKAKDVAIAVIKTVWD